MEVGDVMKETLFNVKFAYKYKKEQKLRMLGLLISSIKYSNSYFINRTNKKYI